MSPKYHNLKKIECVGKPIPLRFSLKNKKSKKNSKKLKLRVEITFYMVYSVRVNKIQKKGNIKNERTDV